MAISLQTGLSDLSRELNETNVNVTVPRIGHYNDAVTDFAKERKWPFLVKKNEELLVLANTKVYTIPASVLADWRSPGAIKAIHIGTGEFLPIDWEARNDARYTGKNFFYIDPEETQITFTADLGAAGAAISIHYYFIPARQTNLESGTFPMPDRYRKEIQVLAAAYVQYSRYLDAQGNLKMNLYNRMMGKAVYQQSETHRNKPRKFQHFLQHRGFRRTYPR